MFRKFLSLALVAAVTVLVPATGVTGKNSWIIVRSPNLLLTGDASEKDIRKVAFHLEQFRQVFTQLFPRVSASSPVPTIVVVFRSDRDFTPFKPLYKGKAANVGGYFQPADDVNYIALSTEGESQQLYRRIFHEYVHLIVNAQMSNPPPWFNEGVAEFYSTFDLTDGDTRAVLGRVIPEHINLLREKFIPLKDLFAVDQNSPLYNEKSLQGIFYAESWALVHYLILGNGGRRDPQLSAFLLKLSTGMGKEKAFSEAFQTDYGALEKELRGYIELSAFSYEQPPIARLESTAIGTAAPATEAQVQAYLGDLLLHINRLDVAEKHEQQALLLDPDCPMALASMGMIYTREKKFNEAKEHLEKAVKLDPRNFLFHYYYAAALSATGIEEGQLVSGYPPEATAVMRAELTKAIELNPGYPESYRLLAFVNLVSGEQLDNSIALLHKALAIVPGNDSYIMVLAQVYLHKHDFQSARGLLTLIAERSIDPRLRDETRELLERSASYEARIARINSEREKWKAEHATETVEGENVESVPPDPAGRGKLLERMQKEALRKSLRKAAPGEAQIRGLLLEIHCGANDVMLLIKGRDREYRIRATNFDRLQVTSYTRDMKGELGCGRRSPANPVVVTYKPASGHAASDGEAVALEFVPPEYQDQ